MLSFEEIEKYFDPPPANRNPIGMLQEYLQCEFLDSLYKLSGSENLIFSEGSAIRIIYQASRFSDGLIFENAGGGLGAIEKLLNQACVDLDHKGFKTEKEYKEEDGGVFFKVEFPGLAGRMELLSHQSDKIVLNIEIFHAKKHCEKEVKILKRFGVFRMVPLCTPGAMLAQKLALILSSRKERGIDFFDAAFLFCKTDPDFEYIKKNMELGREKFIEELNVRCSRLDFQSLAENAAPFLFNKDEQEKILNFKAQLAAKLKK